MGRVQPRDKPYAKPGFWPRNASRGVPDRMIVAGVQLGLADFKSDIKTQDGVLQQPEIIGKLPAAY
jgi:hypothetical protein